MAKPVFIIKIPPTYGRMVLLGFIEKIEANKELKEDYHVFPFVSSKAKDITFEVLNAPTSKQLEDLKNKVYSELKKAREEIANFNNRN